MFTTITNPKLRGEVLRFALVGVATFALNLSAFYFFFRFLQLDYRHAVTYAYVITVISHFTASKLFTFAARWQPLGRNATRYAFMLVLNYCITLAVSWLVIGLWNMPGYVAVVGYTAGNALSTFLLMKHVVFRPGAGQSAEGMP